MVVLISQETHAPYCYERQMVTKLHQVTHLGASKMAKLLRPRYLHFLTSIPTTQRENIGKLTLQS